MEKIKEYLNEKIFYVYGLKDMLILLICLYLVNCFLFLFYVLLNWFVFFVKISKLSLECKCIFKRF